jgi:hypothetical protein
MQISLRASNLINLIQELDVLVCIWWRMRWRGGITSAGRNICRVRLAYQPPASSTFLPEQTNHQQPANNTFFSKQMSTSHQPNEQADSLDSTQELPLVYMLWIGCEGK